MSNANDKILLYSDFNCPFCYALDEILLDLGLGGAVTWRGVQHAPQLPVPMTVTPGLALELRWEVDHIRRLAPQIPIQTPPAKPNTALAIAMAAAAISADAERGRRFKQSIYRAFWERGEDISQIEVLERLASEHSFPHLIPDFQAAERWQRQWERSGIRGVPSMQHPDGSVLSGLVAPQRVQDFFHSQQQLVANGASLG